MTSNPLLFRPLTIRATTFRNRLWVSPMCQYSVEKRDGIATDWHFAHLGSFARGGAGLVITEATAVVPEGRISPQDLGLWNDEQQAALAPIVDFIHSQGAAAGIQLAHAGRKASTYRQWSGTGSVTPDDGGWQTVAPSAIAFDGYAVPRELTPAEIAGVVESFARAATRAVNAGFDVVEIHAAHGYLLHQFLSPLSNTREDSYGGSLENRARLLLEVIAAVRAVIGETTLFVRFSATDWADGGWDVDDTIAAALLAERAGADLFDISTGGLVGGINFSLEPGYQVPFAEAVKAAVASPVSAVGLITDAAQAEEVLVEGRADAVMMGREMLRDPHTALRAAYELDAAIDYWPLQYTRAAWRTR